MSSSLTDNRPGNLVERHDNLPRHPFDTENMYSICDDQVLSENMSSSPTTDSGVSNRVLTLATLPLYLGDFWGHWHDDGHLHLSRTAGELQRLNSSGELGV